MNKKLLFVAALALVLTGCDIESHSEVEIFPGQEAVMVAMCNPNGGFVRGYVSEYNRHYYKSVTVQTYVTRYHVECANGAKIDKSAQKENPL